MVGCESACGLCDGGIGLEWDERDFERHCGQVPATVAEAEALVARERCDWCGAPHRVWQFSTWTEWNADGEPVYEVDYWWEPGA